MLRAYLYDGASGQVESQVPVSRFPELLARTDVLLWVDIQDPEDADIEMLLEVFELHPLTVEDCIMPNLRPKLEEFDRYLFVVLHGLKRNEKKRLAPAELDCCLGSNFLLTIRSETIRVVDEDCARIQRKSPIIKRGGDFLFYSIANSLIDSYFPILDELEAKVDELETRLLDHSTKEILTELLGIYNELMIFRRVLAPHREILGRFNRGELALIKPANSIYFRDIYDHLLRMSDLVDSCREVTTVAMEAYATIVSNRLNEIMKTMTAMATLTIPFLIISGIYGMNFSENPELGPRIIYHVMSTMFLISVPIMFFYFRRYKWL